MSIDCETVVSAFDDLGIVLEDAKATDRLVALCDIYGLDADRISTEFLGWACRKNMSSDTEPSLELLEAFEKEFLKSAAAKIKAKSNKENVINVSSLVQSNGKCDDHDLGGAMEDDGLASVYGLSTPKGNHQPSSKRHLTPENSAITKKRFDADSGTVFSPASLAPNLNSSLSSSPSGLKYANRQKPGSTLIAFGDIKISDWNNANGSFVPLIRSFNDEKFKSLGQPYRYMHETLKHRGEILDEIIWRTSELLIENKGGEKLPDPVDGCQSNVEEVTAIGRVVSEIPGARLNAHSVLLEGTMELSDGRSVQLDLSKCPEYSMFPGQIVAVQGINPNGSKFVVKKIHSDISSNMVQLKDKVKALTGPLDVFVAAGPYTTSDNLLYEPLRDLLKAIQRNKPHVAVLIGPFVDDKHPIIQNGGGEDVAVESFDEIFARVMKMIVETTQNPDCPTQFVLSSSVRDVHHEMVYPTPPFPPSSISDKIHMVSDPALVEIEGVLLGLTSADILFHLGKEEISFPPRSGDRLRRLSSHVLQQRCFYPLYPPPADDDGGDNMENTDMKKFYSFCNFNVKPHVLVLPSDLMHFYKDINGTVVTNPGKLTKKESGGGYARFRIQPRKDSQDGENSLTKERFSGEIVRI